MDVKSFSRFALLLSPVILFFTVGCASAQQEHQQALSSPFGSKLKLDVQDHAATRTLTVRLGPLTSRGQADHLAAGTHLISSSTFHLMDG